MSKKRKIVKSYTLSVVEFEDGEPEINESISNFSTNEVVGILEMAKFQLMHSAMFGPNEEEETIDGQEPVFKNPQAQA